MASGLELPFSLDLKEPLAFLEKNKSLTLVNVGNTAAKSFLIREILRQTPFENVFWGCTDEKAEDLFITAKLWFPDNLILIPKHFSWHQFFQLVSLLSSSTPHLFLFEDIEAFLHHPIPSPQMVESLKLTLKKGQEINVYKIFEQLETLGYRPAEEEILKPGEFLRKGENLFIFPVNASEAMHLELFGDTIDAIHPQQDPSQQKTALDIFPAQFSEKQLDGKFLHWVPKGKRTCFIDDDLDAHLRFGEDFYQIRFTTFPKNEETFFHLNFFSVLPFYTIPDFVTEVKERLRRGFTVVIMTKRYEEMVSILREYEIMFTEDLTQKAPSTAYLIKQAEDKFLPHSFQNNDYKIYFLTDREIFQFRRSSRQKKDLSSLHLELLNSLKPGDFVVHIDHGIAQFEGIVRRKILEGEREYLKLKYAEGDRLFVPVESAEKVSKFIGDEEPKLTRLGGTEWKNIQKKLKAETEKIAKELLEIYAARELAEGFAFAPDDDMMRDFCDAFPYELTPGQLRAWEEVRIDMERPKPMDRLVCGDVGFGKTEIAMRAAFKAFRSGVQCAFLAPITILAEQHYQSFLKRIKGKSYGIRVELLSRFQSPAEQKRILRDLKLGLIDVIIGTHRLLSPDVEFKNLRLLIIDEEQRFGVQQKEQLKKMRSNLDILTLTATPIPRTLHMGLNKLKDVSTITTPPPGRLPVITEVRKYNLNLIRERILFELNRKGQVYFLHNEVKTIESQAQQLRNLVPEARFLVAHGQMPPQELEQRIRQFKAGEADVLVASTIIENGIDLPNANTLFVNRAERFGLAQLYQLRGRVGRSRTQAYAYFLYHGQKLDLDAKKRLRAIVEASELGAGFQIAMRDLEIRGAGEILGANQSGAIKDAGVTHFMRVLQRTVEELKAGEKTLSTEEEESITVEIPLTAYIPPHFIPDADEKIRVYQELAAAESPSHLQELKASLQADYGKLPKEVLNLCKVIYLKLLLRKAHLSGVRVHQTSHKAHEIILRMGTNFSPEQIFQLLKNTEKKWKITSNALKLTLEHLPISWYEDLVEEVKKLIPAEKAAKNTSGTTKDSKALPENTTSSPSPSKSCPQKNASSPE